VTCGPSLQAMVVATAASATFWTSLSSASSLPLTWRWAGGTYGRCSSCLIPMRAMELALPLQLLAIHMYIYIYIHRYLYHAIHIKMHTVYQTKSGGNRVHCTRQSSLGMFRFWIAIDCPRQKALRSSSGLFWKLHGKALKFQVTF
jgi:hypothetical protein